MSTHRAELNDLQEKACLAGRTCTFCINENTGYIDSVFYLDPYGPGKQKSGVLLDPLSFAERERAKLQWWQEKKGIQWKDPRPNYDKPVDC